MNQYVLSPGKDARSLVLGHTSRLMRLDYSSLVRMGFSKG